MKNLHDLGKRLIVSFISVLILGGLLVFSHSIWMKGIILIAFLGVASVAMWEYVQLAKVKQIVLSSRLLVISAMVLMGGFFAASQCYYFHKLPLFLFFILLFFIFLFHFRTIDGSLVKISLSTFGLLYTTIPLGMLLMILFSLHGVFWFIYLIAITKITDMGAYFGGRLLGNIKLCQISPQKTWEGAIFGFVCAIACSLLFSFTPFLTWKEALLYGVFIGSIGQIGDLAESLLKRDAQIKDSNTIPGLGGILDMVDSLLFTTPTLFFFL